MNLNGTILPKHIPVLYNTNRAFKYGDALFETLKVVNSRILFLEDHYFRLMASMRMLRMEIPLNFSMVFFQDEINKTVTSLNLENARVRVTVYRSDGGLYLPENNAINYLIEATNLDLIVKNNYEIDIFKDYFVASGLLATLKTTNKIINTLASIYASENNLDNCILLNEKKNVVEVINGNIFIVIGNLIKTPPIAEGCIKGIIRKKIIEIIVKSEQFDLEEIEISPFELLKADELFITNSISGIQPVKKYKKKAFITAVSMQLEKELSYLV